MFDPTGNSSIEPGNKDITASEGADDLDADALGGYIWDTVLRAGKTVRHYGLYADENYYVVPSAGYPLYSRLFATRSRRRLCRLSRAAVAQR